MNGRCAAAANTNGGIPCQTQGGAAGHGGGAVFKDDAGVILGAVHGNGVFAGGVGSGGEDGDPAGRPWHRGQGAFGGDVPVGCNSVPSAGWGRAAGSGSRAVEVPGAAGLDHGGITGTEADFIHDHAVATGPANGVVVGLVDVDGEGRVRGVGEDEVRAGKEEIDGVLVSTPGDAADNKRRVHVGIGARQDVGGLAGAEDVAGETGAEGAVANLGGDDAAVDIIEATHSDSEAGGPGSRE